MLQVVNSFDQLTNSKASVRIKTLLEDAPTLQGRASVNLLSAQVVKLWLREERIYCLTHKIHWSSFSRYLVTKQTLHPYLLSAVKRKMSDKQLQTETAWTLSTFIKKIILEQLPREQRYDISQSEMIATHVEHLVGEHSDTRYLRQHLDDVALSLTWNHPYFKQAKEINRGFVGPAEQIKITMQLKKAMLVDIVTKAGFRSDLQKSYGNCHPRTKLDSVLPAEVKGCGKLHNHRKRQ